VQSFCQKKISFLWGYGLICRHLILSNREENIALDGKKIPMDLGADMNVDIKRPYITRDRKILMLAFNLLCPSGNFFFGVQKGYCREVIMSEAIMSQLLGVNDMTLESIRLGRRPEGLGQPRGESQFGKQLEALMGDAFSANSIDQPGVMKPGIDPSRIKLNELYKSAMLTALRDGSETGEITDEVNKESDLLNTSSTDELLAAEEDSNLLDGESQLTASEIVFTAGNSNSDLIEKMNAAATIEERLEYAVQLRDKIIDALKENGYTAEHLGKPDKISINGETYDVIRASRRMGRDGGIQFMKVGPATDLDNLKEAIFSAGEKNQDLLTGISPTASRTERNNMAVSFRNQVIDNLLDQGFDAKATDSPDKIEVNGQVFDIIRSLNDPNSAALFQVLAV
jgi:hypothetical protein